MKHNASVPSVHHPSEPALPVLTGSVGTQEPKAPQLWWEKELLIIGNRADPDPRGTEPSPAAMEMNQHEMEKNNEKIPKCRRIYLFCLRSMLRTGMNFYILFTKAIQKYYCNLSSFTHSANIN